MVMQPCKRSLKAVNIHVRYSTLRCLTPRCWWLFQPGEQEDGGPGSYTIEDVKARQSKSVMKWLEHRVGAEKLQLAKLLQEHNVIVRGGAEQGQKLMDALLVRLYSSVAQHCSWLTTTTGMSLCPLSSRYYISDRVHTQCRTHSINEWTWNSARQTLVCISCI